MANLQSVTMATIPIAASAVESEEVKEVKAEEPENWLAGKC
jgi:hypothetical protein